MEVPFSVAHNPKGNYNANETYTVTYWPPFHIGSMFAYGNTEQDAIEVMKTNLDSLVKQHQIRILALPYHQVVTDGET